ncbi:uncharacterized protein LOC124365020 [Homalodisca vitripennis]|uniref:uncharacterized protein LOC124365020 n=1 Tax=Homalodisca vitripennis TaxID=197043 RepID=UPI001EEA3501|nr:uncharacterized protein LOC124365020 [Homalodisca vitripennis]
MVEDLVKDIKKIFKQERKDDEGDKYLFFSPKYSPIVKIDNWFLPLEAEPKDNDPYHPPGGNYFLSSYKRYGTQDVPMESTTQAMLRQICSARLDLSVHKPLVTMATDRLLSKTDVIRREPHFQEEEFTTTYNYDYRNPLPHRRQYGLKHEEKTRKFGLKSLFLPSKICNTKFLDDEEYSSKPAPAPALIPPYENHNSMVC